MATNINGIFPGELFPTETIGGCIDVFEGAWPNPKKTIEDIEAECSNLDSGVNWARATTLQHGANQNVRTNYHMSITALANNLNNPPTQNIHNQTYLLLLAATIPYAKKHDIDEMFHEGYNMLRYSGGQEYKAHKDGDTGSGRAVSAIIYLNDDYEGGHVEFVNFGIKIKPKPGMLLLFPSNYAYTHIAHPVTSGTKYAIVTWIHDRPL
jgi:predicted 2-oxoglutarate/Fe(II)-dependent dioxygenase YbiX